MLWALPSTAQKEVKGSTVDTAGKPVSSIGILLMARNGLILAYQTTDSAGRFRIPVPDSSSASMAWLVVQSLEYLPDTLRIKPGVLSYDFRLRPSVSELQSVTVYNSKATLQRRSDTLIYNADSLSWAQDRVVGDVLKKIPGIEIGPDGEIRYQGKAINRFYVDGDDIVGGNYNTLSNNLPNDIVKSIQVLENHQPVKALSSVELSNAAAINIVLKPRAKMHLIGDGSITAGLPSLYNLEQNLFLFTGKLKLIGSVKMNNMGIDPAKDLVSHFNEGGNIPSARSIIGVAPAMVPLTESRYLFNNSRLLNFNTLFKIAKSTDLKVNINYFADRIHQSSLVSDTYFFQNDTLSIHTRRNLVSRPEIFNPQLTLLSNSNRFFLTNVISVTTRAKKDSSAIVSNTADNFSERAASHLTSVSNSFRAISGFARNKLFELSSVVMWSTIPQDLTAAPGALPNYFNGGLAYAALQQQVDNPGIVATNSATIRFIGKLNQSFKIGYDFEHQSLNSQLHAIQLDGTRSNLSDSFYNSLSWNRNAFYMEGGLSYVKGKSEVSFRIPLRFVNTRFESAAMANGDHITRRFLQPSLNMRLPVGREGNINVMAGWNNAIGTIYDVYPGYIMTSYRDISARSKILPENGTFYTTLHFANSKTLSLLFYNVHFDYSNTLNNTIGYTDVTGDFTKLKQKYFPNRMENMSLSASVSKYIIALQTTFTVSGSVAGTNMDYISNADLLQTRNIVASGGYKLSAKLSRHITMIYDATFSTSKTSPRNNDDAVSELNQQSFFTRHRSVLTLQPSKALLLKVLPEYYHSHATVGSDNKAFFLDASVTLQSKKLHSDIEWLVNNLFNQSDFASISNTASILSERHFMLRGINTSLRVKYRF